MAITFSGVTFSGGYQIDPTFVPDAPIIGVATATGATTATVAFTADTPAAATAVAGATVNRLEPRAATATSAMRFFNEIVFTIFLSFSRPQAFPGLGWWSKRPPH
jgi:hypothetical protein